MAVNKRKKNSRQRGSHTHGWGSKKKHRGSGNKGGAGRSGSGKRADSKKPSVWKIKNYFGKHGFKSKKRKARAVNISYIEENLKSLISKKLSKESAGGYLINLSDIGFDKLLGGGKATKKLIITCKAASERAVNSIEGKGGKVILPTKEETTNGNKGNTSQPS